MVSIRRIRRSAASATSVPASRRAPTRCGQQILGLPGLPGTYNCRTCHDNQNPKVLPFQPEDRAAADKDAWQVNITQEGCGSCHPVDFTNHYGNQPDDLQCELCHGTDRSLPVSVAHATPYSTPNNPELYPGAKKVEYAIQSVTVDAAGKPTVRFSIKVDGAPLDLNGPPSRRALRSAASTCAWSGARRWASRSTA